MRVVIAGGHGKIALLLERLLAERGDQAVGLIRNPAHAADVQNTGAEAVVCDLEAAAADDVAVLLSGTDAVVFAAGAGAGRGAPRARSPAPTSPRSLPPCSTTRVPGTDAAADQRGQPGRHGRAAP